MTRVRSIAVYLPICLLLLARIVNAGILSRGLYTSLVDAVSTLVGSEKGMMLPYTKVEWFLATFQTTYVPSINSLKGTS